MLSRYPAAALLLVLLASVAGSPRSAGAASINYGDFSGATLTFQGVTESSITDPVPLFGSPSPSGDSLSFAPQTFLSASSGGADTTSGTLSITLQANPGQFLQKIVVAEAGTYAFSTDVLTNGTGQVSISGLLTVTDLSSGTGVHLASLVVVPSGSLSYAGPNPTFVDGTWTASASIDLSGLGITKARIQLNNNLQSLSSTVEVGAHVRKDSVTITNTPEPGTALLVAAGLGGLGLAGRRRNGRG